MKRTYVLSTAAGLIFVATAAQAQRGQDDRRGHQDQRQDQHQDQRQVQQQDQRQVQQQDQRQVQHQDQHQDQRGQVSPPEQQRRVDVDRGRAVETQQRGIDEQRRDLQMRQRAQEEQADRARRAQQEEQLERARRVEQEERLEQARRAELNRVYDRDRDYRPGYDYRYNMGGVYRETNQYGVDVLRQALDQGYEQGYRAGQTDRRNGAPADFRRAFEYQNGGYSYSGNYVPQSDYTYYLREGFQRGYDDAYWNRARYGTFYNGNPSILGNIVAGILGLTTIR